MLRERYAWVTVAAIMRMLLSNIGWDVRHTGDGTFVILDNHGHQWLMELHKWPK